MTDNGDTLSDSRHPFFTIDNVVVEQFDLTPFEGWLYAVIVMHADRKTHVAFPGFSTLAKEAKMSRRMVVRCIQTLEDKRLITVDRSPKTVKIKEVNHYKVNDPHQVLTSFANEGTEATDSAPDALPSASQSLVPSAQSALPDAQESLPLVSDMHLNKNHLNKNHEQEKPFADAPNGAQQDTAIQIQEPAADALSIKPAKPKKPRKPSAHSLMFEAICKAFGYDWTKMTASKHSNIGRVDRELREAGAVPADIPAFYAWCVSQNWTNFTEAALATHWDDYKKVRAPCPAGNGYRKPDPNCPICAGMGAVLPAVPPDDPRYNKPEPCSCVKGKVA